MLPGQQHPKVNTILAMLRSGAAYLTAQGTVVKLAYLVHIQLEAADREGRNDLEQKDPLKGTALSSAR